MYIECKKCGPTKGWLMPNGLCPYCFDEDRKLLPDESGALVRARRVSGTDESLVNQIKMATETMRVQITHRNWEAVRVEAQFCGDLDTELRTRKNERNKALGKRVRELREDEGWSLREARLLAQAEVSA